MPRVARHFYEFGSFRLDADRHRLTRDGELVHLSPKAIEALLVLVQNPGQLLAREALMQAVWADAFVEDANLTVAISHLRKALGQNGETAEYIETVPRAGYRFVADVREVVEEPAPLVIEKRTLSRTVIEEEEIESRPPEAVPAVLLSGETIRAKFRRLNNRLIAMIAILMIVGVGIAGVWWTRRDSSPARRPLPITSIAVLPFQVISTKPDTNHQGVGLADVLITRLSNLRQLKVRPTSAVLAFEPQRQDSINFGRQLGVDAILEGTIYRATDKVRVTARLLRIGDGSAIWSGQFERSLPDELDIQREISMQMVDALVLNLSGNERDALTKRHTENADAYQLYLKGRYEWNRRTWSGMIEAERLFRNAIEKDPNFALAYVGIADVLVMTSAGSRLVFPTIQKALELDPNLAEAYATLGFARTFHAWQWQEAETAFKKSIELNPGYATAHHWYAQLLTIQGRHEEAKAEMRRALEINPLSHNLLADLGQIYYFNHDYKTAEEYCRKALDTYPDFEFAHKYLSFIYLKTGEHDKALEEMIVADRIHSTLPKGLGERQAEIQGASDWTRKMYREGGIRKVLQARTNKPSDGDLCYLDAVSYAFLGEKDKAVNCLECAYEDRVFLSAFVRADPIFDDLHAEPRYQAILKKMGLDQF